MAEETRVDWTLHEGDCLEVMRELPSESVDAVVTDPPYFLPAQHYAARKEWARSLSDLSILEHFYRDVFAELRRVLRRPGHLLVFCDAQSYPVFYVSAYRHFANMACLVWDKGRVGMGKPWRHQHEMILAAWDPGAYSLGTMSTILRESVVNTVDRDHPAEKPIPLLVRILNAITPPGGTVLDPFAGSGTTLLAAVQEGFSCIGIEREPEYCEIIRRRMSVVAVPPPLAY